MKTIMANWKMYLGVGESARLAARFARALPKSKNRAVICPSASALLAVRDAIKGSGWQLGAQNSATHDRGPLTGEVSPKDLREIGCKYVLIGHSERRAAGETDQMVREKYRAALDAGIKPVLCIGESWKERKAGRAKGVLKRQLEHALHSLKISGECIVAYEPVWAVGTGRPARPGDAAELHAIIRALVTKNASRGIIVRVLYGGSVTLKNVKRFLNEKEIDGLLIGAASTKFEFIRLVKAWP